MRKISTLLLFIAVLQAGAQGYQRLLADSVTVFRIVPLFIPVLEKTTPVIQYQSTNCVNVWSGDYYAQGDSIYNSFTYKKINYGGFVGLMREDTLAKKVYFIQYCNSTEDLLYDFSLQTGDSINYSFPNSSSLVVSGWYKVDSIKFSHDYLGYYRKHFFMHNRLNAMVWPGNYKASLEMIEGVGNTNHPLFLYYWFMTGEMAITGGSNPRCFNTQYDELVSCKWDNGIKVYFDSCSYSTAQLNPCISHGDSCQYSTICSAIEEFVGIKNVSVYPNPATDLVNITIETEKQMNLSFSLVNILGVEVKRETPQQLIKGKNNLQLSVKDLSEGIYLLRISDGIKSTGKTVLINR